MKVNRRILAILTFLVASMVGSPANAGAQDAINAITSGSATLETSDRTVYSGGSMRVFIPQSNTQFVSITPPSYSAGCSGIDAAFGGISFVNGDQLKQAVKNIMASSQGYALDLAVRTLCPLCSDVMQKIRDVANWANNLAMDSCGASKSLVNSGAELGAQALGSPGDLKSGIFGESAWGSDSFSDACKQLKSGSGGGGWFEDTACSTGAGAVGEIAASFESFLTGVNSGKTFGQLDAQDRAELDTAATLMNKAYGGIIEAGFKDHDVINLILSATGFSFKEGGEPITFAGWDSEKKIQQVAYGECTGDSEGQEIAGGTAFNSGLAIYYLLMLGNSPMDDTWLDNVDPSLKVLYQQVSGKIANATEVLNELDYYYCSSIKTEMDKPSSFLSCAKSTDIQKVKIGDVTSGMNEIIAGEGVLPFVAKNLIEAVDRIYKGKGLNQQQMNIVVSAGNVPVYRILKIAAVYPDVAQDLVMDYASYISNELVRAMMTNYFSPEQIGDVPWEAVAPYRRLMDEITSMFVEVPKHCQQSVFQQRLAMNNVLLGRLTQIERVIGEQAIMDGSAGASLFTRRLGPSGSSR